MNLRRIANGVVSGINPNREAVLKLNAGYTVDEAGRQQPSYTEEAIVIQTQSLSTSDLEHLNLAGQQGQFLYAYANGKISALRRAQGKGAETMVFVPYGESEPAQWLVKQVVESYPDWVKVLLWRQ